MKKSRENQKLPSLDVFIRRKSVNLLDETSGIVQYTYQICTKLLPGSSIKKRRWNGKTRKAWIDWDHME